LVKGSGKKGGHRAVRVNKANGTKTYRYYTVFNDGYDDSMWNTKKQAELRVAKLKREGAKIGVRGVGIQTKYKTLRI